MRATNIKNNVAITNEIVLFQTTTKEENIYLNIGDIYFNIGKTIYIYIYQKIKKCAPIPYSYLLLKSISSKPYIKKFDLFVLSISYSAFTSINMKETLFFLSFFSKLSCESNDLVIIYFDRYVYNRMFN